MTYRNAHDLQRAKVQSSCYSKDHATSSSDFDMTFFKLRHSIASKPLYLKVKISTARLIDILVLKSGFQKENEIDKPQTMTDFPLPAIHDKKLWRSQEGAGEVLPTRMAKGGKKCKQESEKEN